MQSGMVIDLDERLRWLAVVAGVAIVAAVVATLQVPRGHGLPSADVVFVAAPTGELGVSPVGAFVTGTGLRPGSEARGHLAVKNQTGKPLAIQVRALPDSADLDDSLRVQVDSHAGRAFDGTLGGLRAGARVPIAPGTAARLDFHVWLPKSLEGGYGGRVVSVSLDLRADIVRG
jgi:hypothetical protein